MAIKKTFNQQIEYNFFGTLRMVNETAIRSHVKKKIKKLALDKNIINLETIMNLKIIQS